MNTKTQKKSWSAPKKNMRSHTQKPKCRYYFYTLLLMSSKNNSTYYFVVH